MRTTATMLLLLVTTPAGSAELQPHTVAAFDRYVKATEARTAAQSAFLWVDSLPAAQRQSRIADLRAGMLLIERLTTLDGRREISIPDGLVHHWVGTVFAPGATVNEAVALLQDYNRHADVYRPAVVQSRVLNRQGERFQVFLRFSMTKVITVVVNSEHDAQFVRDGPDRARSRIYSTRISQVEDAGTPGERELPVGQDGGYMWRLNTYWRFLERDGGTYVQCESISLTRGIPFGFGWMIGPFVTSIPRESLEFTLNTTRKTLSKSRS
ncbi:MAG: hypothetical protein HOP16_12890 [Acidobacteria bacterium]|nr:hypothetical protein [Acidobacteriota bacterium]